MEWITSPEAWISLATLTVLEIVLGIDNIVFLSILADRLPPKQQNPARQFGLILAMATRILLLLSISFIMRLTEPFVDLFGHPLSGRDLILVGGGLFLLTKSTREIHHRLEGDEERSVEARQVSFLNVIVQIAVLDMVFSLDSVITAVGIADELPVMIIAIVVAVLVMMVSAGAVSDFVTKHPTVKMLALSFLLLIGMTLIAEGLGQHIPKGYIYFAMGFSLFVEFLNLRARSSTGVPIRLRSSPPGPMVKEDRPAPAPPRSGG
ncbi:MAG: TerC family protein [Gemmatimonadota bacterium]|nr:TerC family protein [Gemmatimonadota bacterium]